MRETLEEIKVLQNNERECVPRGWAQARSRGRAHAQPKVGNRCDLGLARVRPGGQGADATLGGRGCGLRIGRGGDLGRGMGMP